MAAAKLRKESEDAKRRKERRGQRETDEKMMRRFRTIPSFGKDEDFAERSIATRSIFWPTRHAHVTSHEIAIRSFITFVPQEIMIDGR